MEFLRWKVVQSVVRKLRKEAVVMPVSGFELHYDAEEEPFRVLLFTPTENVYVGECQIASAFTTSEFSRAANEIKSELAPDTDISELVSILREFGYSPIIYDPPKRVPPPYTGEAGKSPAKQHKTVEKVSD